MTKDTPHISDELIAYLEAKFPDRLPAYRKDEYELGRLVGAVDVVRHLKMARDLQRENILETTNVLLKGS